MTGFTDRHFFLLAVVFYGVSTIYSVFLWRKGFRQDDRTNYFLLLSAVGFHTIAMAKRGFSLSRCPVNNLYEATLFVMWTITAVVLALGVARRFRFIGVFASPVLLMMGVFALMPQLDIKGPHPDFSNGLSSFHAASILLAYGAFGLSAIAGLMFLFQEHDLKFDKLRAVFSLLPPIERLEAVSAASIWAGFWLLTAGLAISPPLLHQRFGVYFKADPKILWSIVVWLLYLGVILRRRYSRRGRSFALGSVGSFLFVLLTFWGFNLLSKVHQP